QERGIMRLAVSSFLARAGLALAFMGTSVPAQAPGAHAASDSAQRLISRGDSIVQGGTAKDLRAAVELYSRAASISRVSRDPSVEADALQKLADLHIQLGESDSALAINRRVLLIRRQQGSRKEIGTALLLLGESFVNLSRPDSALAYLRQALLVQRTARDT